MLLAGRSFWDRFHTLWASWGVEQRPYIDDSSTKLASPDLPISKIWFGGDTGLRKVPRGRKQEEMPICPVFEQIGERFGGFDLAASPIDTVGGYIYALTRKFFHFQLVPIGAFSPRGAFSAIHASPDDAVEIHLLVKSKRSIGMHWGCWTLSDEPFMQDPQCLKQACMNRGVDPDEFNTLYICGTLRQTPSSMEVLKTT